MADPVVRKAQRFTILEFPERTADNQDNGRPTEFQACPLDSRVFHPHDIGFLL